MPPWVRKPPFAIIARVTRDGDMLAHTPISAAEFYAIETPTTPTGDQS